MFSGQSPTRVNIDEANKHLQLLYSRVAELEQTVAERTSAFEKREQELKDEHESLMSLKNAEIQRKTFQMEELHKRNSELTDQLKAKDKLIKDLQEKSKTLDDIVQHKRTVESLLACMNKIKVKTNSTNTSASDAKPQVQTFQAGAHQHQDSSLKAPKLKEWPKPNLDLSPTISQMARNYRHSTKSRQFSISEDESLDDSETIGEDVFARPNLQPDKELYL